MNTKRRIAFFAAAGLAFAGAMVLAMSGCQTPIENPTGGNPDANAAPDGLTVTDETVDSISLEWSVSAGAAGYKVYHAATEDGEFAEAGVIEDNAYTVSGLPPDTSFWYKVSAIKGTAETEQSEAVKGTTKSAASGGGGGGGGGGSGSGEDADITAPTGLLFSGASANSVTLSWDVFEGAAGYKIYRSGTANGGYTYTATSDVNSYTDSGLAPNSTYFYKVSALVSPSGESGLSTAAGWKTGSSGGTGGGALPAAPSGLRVTGVTTTSITLSWDAVAGAVFYRIYRASSASGNYTQVVTSEVIPCSDYGLASGTTYYYKVCAVKAPSTEGGMGEAGALSGHIAETTGSPPAAGLAPPSGLWFTGITDTSISLSWTETSGATGYKVYRSLSASGAFAHAGSTGGFSQTSFTDTGLASGTIYYYKVSSIDTGGESPMSAVVGNKTSVPEAAQGSVPPAPAGLSIAEVTSGSISLSWTAVSGASYYKIYRADSASGTYIQAGLSDVNSYTNYALTPNTTYYYKISAVNDTGESAQSGAVFGTTTSSAGTQSVTQLNLSGIVAAPEENDTPQTAPNALSHNQYTITALTWQTDSGGAVSGAFAAGIVYKVTLSLQAQGAYTFSGIGVDAFTCNGANSVTAAIAGQMATVTITFPVTKSNVILPDATTANDFITRLNEIKNNGVPDTIYAIPLTSDISIAPQILNASYDSALRNTTIRIVGDINERTITLNSDGSLFTLQGQSEANKFTFVLGNNIKLRGKSSNTASVVRVNNYAEFIMEGGAICGNTVSAVAETYALAGGVAVYNGTFTMAGGIISGNTARASTTVYNGRSAYGGGVYVGGTFIMLGGTISGNSASASSSAPCTAYGGGVYAGGGTFIMSGGTISGNSASAITPYGGGVYIDGTCAFIKTGDSIIYGNDADASLKNTASNGAAVYVNSGSKKRNSTAYASDTMDSNLSGAAGGWE